MRIPEKRENWVGEILPTPAVLFYEVIRGTCRFVISSRSRESAGWRRVCGLEENMVPPPRVVITSYLIDNIAFNYCNMLPVKLLV